MSADADTYLNNIIAAQQHYLERLETHTDTLLMLAEKSEARIDRTNAMVDKLITATTHAADTLHVVTVEYTKQIDKLAGCRDALMEQNNKLLELHNSDQEHIKRLWSEIRNGRDDIIAVLKDIGRGVKIENNFDK